MLKQDLQDNIKTFIKAKAEDEKIGARMAMAAIKNKEIELRRDLTDEEIIVILKKQVKEHRESLSFLKEDDVVNIMKYNAFIESIIYLIPEEMSKEEATEIITKILADKNITLKAQKGQAMGAVMKELKGKLDGKIIQNIVDSILV